MTDSTERFSNRVANYVKYRPGYSTEILKLFCKNMGLDPSSVIADVGSGTGISAKLFLENGNKVYGVEPNAAMRGAAETFLQTFPRFRSIDGTAGNTSLENESMEFVVAAQPFHWSDAEKTRQEFRRILRPSGFVALIWNERDLDSNEFLREFEHFQLKYGTDYKEVLHKKNTPEMIGRFIPIGLPERLLQTRKGLILLG